MSGPAVTWLLPFAHDCVAAKRDRLVVTASSTARPKEVVFRADGKRVGVDRSSSGGVFAVDWSTSGLKKGPHRLTATFTDGAGRSDTAGRSVRACGK